MGTTNKTQQKNAGQQTKSITKNKVTITLNYNANYYMYKPIKKFTTTK